MVLIFTDFYWSICWQVAVATMQIVYKQIADFFLAKITLNFGNLKVCYSTGANTQ